jgi:hypothetical protein
MIVERMIFNLKYGKEEESAELWKKMNQYIPETNASIRIPTRIYASLTGRTNRICQDILIKSINDHNPLMYYWVINPRIQELYRQFVSLCDSAQREMYKIEHETGSLPFFDGAITERHTFHLHFGQAKPSIATWQTILDEAETGNKLALRMMTDIVGPSYTLIVEAHYINDGGFRPGIPFWSSSEKLTALHEEFKPYCDCHEIEYLRIGYDYR